VIARKKRSDRSAAAYQRKTQASGKRGTHCDQLVFFQCKRQWASGKKHATRLQRFNRDLDVPVVGRNNTHQVDIFAVDTLR